MTDEVTQFDPIKYKETTREQWQTAAEPWYRWGPTIEEWLGQATETMLDMAEVGSGRRVLDVAAGTGGQTIAAARRIGPTGYILATDISSNILEFASEAARQEGLLGKVETRVMDGESLQELEQESFDAVISRLGLSYFPDQQKALTGAWRTLKPGGGSRPLSTRHLRTTSSSPSRCRSSANVPNFRRRCPGGQGHSVSAGSASSKRRTKGPVSEKRRRASFPHRYACPPPQSMFASRESRSGRFTR
jgi:ubiquinone/menaquinone biosynthesis C-methylase UbiE